MNLLQHLDTALARRRPPGARPVAVHAPPAPMQPAIPTVSGVISRWGPWLPGVVLLGVADDGVPFAGKLWQHWRNRLDHLLILGADDHTLLRLLEPILYSMAFQATRYGNAFRGHNEPMGMDVWQYFIFSPRAVEAWHPLVSGSALCRGIHPPTLALLEKALGRLADGVRVRQRRGPTHEGREYWPWLILVLDDFGRYAAQLSRKAQADFQTLLVQGKEVGIHVFVTACYRDAGRVPAMPATVAFYGSAQGVDLTALPRFRGLEAVQALPPHRMYIPSGGKLMAATAPIVG